MHLLSHLAGSRCWRYRGKGRQDAFSMGLIRLVGQHIINKRAKKCIQVMRIIMQEIKVGILSESTSRGGG